MPIVYEDVVRGRTRSAFDLPASTGEVLTETFAQAYEENPIMAFSRMLELREDQRTGPRLSVEQARARLSEAGMEGDIEVSEAGITDAALTTLMERKRIEKRRQETFALAEGGFGQGAARLGVAAITSLTDPVSAALNFVPVVGQARYARMLGGAGTLLGRTGVRVGVGAAEGAAGAAIVEPLIYAMRTQEQADYDAVDSLLNVALGGAVGSGLHVTVGSVGELVARSLPERVQPVRQEPTVGAAPVSPPLSRAMDAPSIDAAVSRIDAMRPEDQHAVLRTAVAQAADGQPIDVEAFVREAMQRTQRGPAAQVVVRDEPAGTQFVQATTNAGAVSARIDGGAMKVISANIPDPQMRGRGAGVAMYEALAREAEARGVRLVSDTTVEAPAVRMYEALERRGYVVERNPEARPVDGIEGALFGPRDTPVFTVRGRTAASSGATRRATQAATDMDYRAATEAADATLKDAIPDAPDEAAAALDDLAALAETDARELAKRLGLEFKDADMDDMAEAAAKAERWARAAELATVCLVRGG